MYETRVENFKSDHHIVRIWEDPSTGKRCIEVIDTLDDGSSVYIESLDEVVTLVEMLVKAGGMLCES